MNSTKMLKMSSLKQTIQIIKGLEFKEGADQTKIQNVEELFIGHGSYLRRDGQVLMHALSKYTALVEDFGNTPNLIFQGQPNASINLYSPKSLNSLNTNNVNKKGDYDASKKLIQIKIRDNK